MPARVRPFSSLLVPISSPAWRIERYERLPELSASSPELGEAREALNVDYAGGSVEIGFNAQYLLEFLGVVGSEQVLLELKDAESQGLLRPASEDAGDYRYVVMPMRF